MKLTNENYEQMLTFALEGEGQMLKGYSLFHNYSFFNQMWAIFQMRARGEQIQPIASYTAWQAMGRQVRYGEKASIELCMPNTWKDKKDLDKDGKPKEKMFFAFRRFWFTLSQTDGADLQLPEIGFDYDKCLETLGIERVDFEMINGNIQGYAFEKKLAINPLAELPAKTFFHELGHILLGHTTGEKCGQRNLKEVEAELVALCCSLALGLEENIPFARGYVKHWLGENEIPAESIKAVFGAVSKILQAGKIEVQ